MKNQTLPIKELKKVKKFLKENKGVHIDMVFNTRCILGRYYSNSSHTINVISKFAKECGAEEKTSAEQTEIEYIQNNPTLSYLFHGLNTNNIYEAIGRLNYVINNGGYATVEDCKYLLLQCR